MDWVTGYLSLYVSLAGEGLGCYPVQDHSSGTLSPPGLRQARTHSEGERGAPEQNANIEGGSRVNQIVVWEPRWHDRVVLVAEYKLKPHNLIKIDWHEYPEPFYLSAKRAREFPLEQMKTKKGGFIAVRAVPLEELTREVI